MIRVLQHGIAYGLLGMNIEIWFTGIFSIISGNKSATSKTFLWMFPIYAIGGMILETLNGFLVWNEWIDYRPAIMAIPYTIIIFAIEFQAGWFLEEILGECPWRYCAKSKQPWAYQARDSIKIHERSIMGWIRWDYCGFWFGLALAFNLYGDRFTHAVDLILRLQ